MNKTTTKTTIKCHHCGELCLDTHTKTGGLDFCCVGCQQVFNLLHSKGLESFYVFENTPGLSQKNKIEKNFEFLSNETVKQQIISFQEGNRCSVNFTIPQIHCSSCLYLLENINKINPGIIRARVNFLEKRASILFNQDQISLTEVVQLLSKIGYEPRLNLDQLDDTPNVSQKYNYRQGLYKLGLAGFAFGNIMLLSFPEYLGFENAFSKMHIGVINIILATPVLLYSGREFLLSAWKSIKQSYLNIDVPVAIGMLALFGRSVYEITSLTGEGYLDSFTGFIFFLLIGNWFRDRTYKSLDFNRTYKSYFPISAMVKNGSKWISKTINELIPGDVIKLKKWDLIPVDGKLLKGEAIVDYSFVTGESETISKRPGDKLLAGAKHLGNLIEMEVLKRVDQSYLTQLWNDDSFSKHTESQSSRLISKVSKNFTLIIIAIAVISFIYWYTTEPIEAFKVFTSVLIVACPCALALAIPFTYGNILRLFSENGFFIKNVNTIEDLQHIDHIVFDKTGTITDSNKIKLKYNGHALNAFQKSLIKSSVEQSNHPLSQAIHKYFSKAENLEVEYYHEEIGYGYCTKIDGNEIRIGSAEYIFEAHNKPETRAVFVEINKKYIGHFEYIHQLRPEMDKIISKLSNEYELSLISGDKDHDKNWIGTLFKTDTQLLFDQKPIDKLNYIKQLQSEGQHVMMVGDGLNDAGALKQSNVGLVISDKDNNFTPACDAIISSSVFNDFHVKMSYIRSAKSIIIAAFSLAFLFNIIGLGFAVNAKLSPIVAAILMPSSSICIVVFGVLSSYLLFKKFFNS